MHYHHVLDQILFIVKMLCSLQMDSFYVHAICNKCIHAGGTQINLGIILFKKIAQLECCILYCQL